MSILVASQKANNSGFSQANGHSQRTESGKNEVSLTGPERQHWKAEEATLQ